MTDTNNPTDEQIDEALAEARERDGDTVIAVCPTTSAGIGIATQLEFATVLIAQMAWEVIRSQMAPALKSVLAPAWGDLPATDRERLLEKARNDIRFGAASAAAKGEL